ncbi:unnamed protein product, partial [Medioppia subpectinata]
MDPQLKEVTARPLKRGAQQMDVDLTETTAEASPVMDMMDVTKPLPDFKPISEDKLQTNSNEFRKIAVPSHRYTPLKENWM